MTIALYLRLSDADGDRGLDGKNESNSIENQRELLRSYIMARDDLEGEVIEYVDDGYTGTNFNRPAFKRMIEDAKKGRIQVMHLCKQCISTARKRLRSSSITQMRS